MSYCHYYNGLILPSFVDECCQLSSIFLFYENNLKIYETGVTEIR